MKKLFETNLRRLLLPNDAQTSTGLAFWRYEFFFKVARLILIGGVFVYGFSLSSYISEGAWQMIVPITSLTVLLYVLVFWRNWNQKYRRWGMVFLFFVLGIYLLTQKGIQGSGLTFLFAHPILAAVFFGRKEAQISLWANGLILTAMNVTLWINPDIRVVMIDYQPILWVSICLTFLFLSAVVTNAIVALVMGLTHTLDAETTAREKLEREVQRRIALENELRGERENLQVRISERTALLAKANEDLMKSMKFKDAFFDSIQHEFRTPIHAISGYTDLLDARNQNLTEKQIGFVARIREAAEHLLAVINNILDTNRIQAGKMTIQPVVLSLKEICANAYAAVEADAARKSIAIKPLGTGVDLNVIADPQRFRQALMNLMQNAVKYTPEGGAAGIEAIQDERGVHLTVWDTGIGIPESDLNTIFQPFYRSENRSLEDVEGTGLGLTLAKYLVEAHGWTLTVDSELDKGSKFTIHIPPRDITENKTALYY